MEREQLQESRSAQVVESDSRDAPATTTATFSSAGPPPPVKTAEAKRRASASERGYDESDTETEPEFLVEVRDLTAIQAADMVNLCSLAKRVELMSAIAKVRGPEFLAQVQAAISTPIHKEDPILASMLVTRVEKGREHLVVHGTPIFKARISQELLRLAATHTGRAALETLLAGPETTTIQFAIEDDFEWEKSVNVDPGLKIGLFRVDGCVVDSPFSVVLLHELVHAVHDLRGELTGGDPLTSDLYHNREEENTIAGDPTMRRPPWRAPMLPRPERYVGQIEWNTPKDLSENAYREEQHLDARFGHHGFAINEGQRGVTMRAFAGVRVWAYGLDGKNTWPFVVPEYDYKPDDIEIDRVCDAMAVDAADGLMVTPAEIERTRKAAHGKLKTP